MVSTSPRVHPATAPPAMCSGEAPRGVEEGSSVSSPLQILTATVYDIAPARDLPVFDPSLTVKKVVFPARWLPRLNRFLGRHAVAIGLAYVVGLVCRSVSVAVPSHIAQWTALATLPLQIVASVNIVVQFRVAFLQLLLRTYDFWYYFAMNAVWATCLAWYLHDWRVAMVPLMWIDVQNATLLDAFLQDFHGVVSAVWVWFLFLISIIAAVSLDVVDNADSHDAVLVTTRWTITVKELLLNAIATVVVLIGRIIYRKRAVLRIQQEATTATRTVQSIALTWPLKLQERAREASTSTPRRLGLQSWQQSFHPTKLQLKLTQRCNSLQASDVMLPQALTRLGRVGVVRSIVRLLGVVGLFATPAVFCLDRQSELRGVLAIVAVVCTAVYTTVVVCFYQRRLLQLLVQSFDFAFISLQLTVVHLCVADAFRWHATPTLCVVSSWLWLHLVITIDALTPAMRRVLGFRSWFQIPVLVLTQVAAVLLWLELSFWDSHSLFNRRFFFLRLGTRELELHVVPCLLSRLLTVVLWASRILFRIATQQCTHELLVIRSHVEFDALFHQHKRTNPDAAVHPSPSPSPPKGPDRSARSSTKTDKIGIWLAPSPSSNEQ